VLVFNAYKLSCDDGRGYGLRTLWMRFRLNTTLTLIVLIPCALSGSRF
jgi:hypothetical protein